MTNRSIAALLGFRARSLGRSGVVKRILSVVFCGGGAIGLTSLFGNRRRLPGRGAVLRPSAELRGTVAMKRGGAVLRIRRGRMASRRGAALTPRRQTGGVTHGRQMQIPADPHCLGEHAGWRRRPMRWGPRAAGPGCAPGAARDDEPGQYRGQPPTKTDSSYRPTLRVAHGWELTTKWTRRFVGCI